MARSRGLQLQFWRKARADNSLKILETIAQDGFTHAHELECNGGQDFACAGLEVVCVWAAGEEGYAFLLLNHDRVPLCGVINSGIHISSECPPVQVLGYVDGGWREPACSETPWVTAVKARVSVDEEQGGTRTVDPGLEGVVRQDGLGRHVFVRGVHICWVILVDVWERRLETLFGDRE